MKLKVVVDERTFEVKVGALNERPVVATVDGERFEVWLEGESVGADPALPEGDGTESPTVAAKQAPAPARRPASPVPVGGPAPSGMGAGVVYAPIPGVVDEVSVREGDVVAVGQPICVLEAMKMKNIIRASRAGEIGRVHVTAGQHVKHHDVLVEFAD